MQLGHLHGSKEVRWGLQPDFDTGKSLLLVKPTGPAHSRHFICSVLGLSLRPCGGWWMPQGCSRFCVFSDSWLVSALVLVNSAAGNVLVGVCVVGAHLAEELGPQVSTCPSICSGCGPVSWGQHLPTLFGSGLLPLPPSRICGIL
jgi:hypothetical protein